MFVIDPHCTYIIVNKQTYNKPDLYVIHEKTEVKYRLNRLAFILIIFVKEFLNINYLFR